MCICVKELERVCETDNKRARGGVGEGGRVVVGGREGVREGAKGGRGSKEMVGGRKGEESRNI